MKNMAGLRDERGLTFVELMFALLLMSILFIGVWEVFTRGFIFWRQSEYKVNMNDSLRISLDRMGRELMFARQPDSTYPTSGGNPGGVLVNSNGSHLYFEIDATPTDEVPNPPSKTIHYYCTPYVLYRQENSDLQPLAEDIESISFTYYDSAGAVVDPGSIVWAALNMTDEQKLQSIENAKAIKQVKIVLTAKKNNSTISPVVIVQKINLRSL